MLNKLAKSFLLSSALVMGAGPALAQDGVASEALTASANVASANTIEISPRGQLIVDYMMKDMGTDTFGFLDRDFGNFVLFQDGTPIHSFRAQWGREQGNMPAPNVTHAVLTTPNPIRLRGSELYGEYTIQVGCKTANDGCFFIHRLLDVRGQNRQEAALSDNITARFTSAACVNIGTEYFSDADMRVIYNFFENQASGVIPPVMTGNIPVANDPNFQETIDFWGISDQTVSEYRLENRPL